MRTPIFLAFIFVCSGLSSFADHPGEGQWSLEKLVEEALDRNLEIKESETSVQAGRVENRTRFSGYFPEFSLVAGSQATRYEGQEDSGGLFYGQVDWNLFSGGRDYYESKVTRNRYQQAQLEIKQKKVEVATEVAAIYYEIAYLLESLALKQKALEMNKEQMKLAKAKKGAGFTSETDVIEFELREATLNADIKELELQRVRKSKDLAVLLGREDLVTGIAVRGHLHKADKLLDESQVFSGLESQSFAVQLAESEFEMRAHQRKAARSFLLPTIDLEGKYGRLGGEEGVYAGDSNYYVGLSIKVPLFSGLEDWANHKKARQEVMGAEFNLRKQKIAVRAELEGLYAELKSIFERQSLEEKTLSRSEEYYRLTLGEYRRGVKNSPDMVSASERLLQSRIRNLEYRRDYQLGLLKIAKLRGEYDPKIVSARIGTK